MMMSSYFVNRSSLFLLIFSICDISKARLKLQFNVLIVSSLSRKVVTVQLIPLLIAMK